MISSSKYQEVKGTPPPPPTPPLPHPLPLPIPKGRGKTGVFGLVEEFC